MKEDFISDKRRVSYLSATYNRIYRGQSVLIEGDFGAGKTRFLKLLRPKKLHAVWVESLWAHSHFHGYAANNEICELAICFRQFHRPDL